MNISKADREAAEMLRVILADVSGFWHKPGDDGPLCIALARHRIQAEQRLVEKRNTTPSIRTLSAMPASGIQMLGDRAEQTSAAA